MSLFSSKDPTARSAGSSRSITQKIAIAVVLVNIVGLAVTSFAITRMSTSAQMETAERSWLHDTIQIGTQAAGGVKWAKVEAIRSAYQVFSDDPSLSMIGFAAFNKAGERLDVWIQADADTAALEDILAKSDTGTNGPTVAGSSDHVLVSAPLPADKDGQSLGQIKTVWSTAAIAASSRAFALQTMAIQAFILILSVAMLLYAMRRFVGRPLADVNLRIGALQAGDISSDIPHSDKGDEIGVVARALAAFCEASRSKLEADAEMERQRQALDAERQTNMSKAERSAQAQRQVVEQLGAALERLAAGDLTVRVPDLGGEFAALEANFNRALEALEDTVATIDGAQKAVQGASDNLGNSTDELAKRTEQQAAALEQTAAALDEVTATVKASAGQAIEAGELVGSTRDAATSSAEIVRAAIAAMGRIEESSSRIAQILKVIDDIAFQTNLLALNAGVEAARAGEAGKGFAVVAQEVRDLAGRSANAAKEIKDLIEQSGTQVSSGVDLVNQTGQSMDQIERQIGEISQKINVISTSAREQSTGLSQINTAINEMDTMTQKNAAMVQDSNASSQKLAEECERLATVVRSFNLTGKVSHGRVSQEPRPQHGGTSAPARQPARHRTHGNAALAQSTESWEEF